MIAWPIQALKKSKLFDKIFVSTDNKLIANTAKKFGAEIPFIRSRNLSDDYTPTLPVIKDAILRLSNLYKIENICCVYPCSPFILSRDFVEAFKILKKNKNRFVFPVIENSHPIQRSFRLKGKKRIIDFLFKSKELSRTQDLEKTYHDAGQFYWSESKTWLKQKKVFNSSSTIIEIPRNRAIDIDTKEDWQFASNMMKIKKK